MGTGKAAGFGHVLFTKVQRRVLGLLFGAPDRTFYVNEIMRFAGTGVGAVHRELQRLTATGVVVASKVGNQKHYQANRESPIFSELRGIVVKTFGVADELRAALAPLRKRIRASFIYGSVARGTDTSGSDIDVMILSDELSFPEAIKALTKAEQQVGRSVNPAIYSLAEWRRNLKDADGFLARVMAQPKLFLIGSEDDLPKSRKPGKDRQAQEGSRQSVRVQRTR